MLYLSGKLKCVVLAAFIMASASPSQAQETK